MTVPVLGSNRKPLRYSGFSSRGGPIKAWRARSEMTCPAVVFRTAANSLAASKTSSSISRVVRMHQMLAHQMRNFKSHRQIVMLPGRHLHPLAPQHRQRPRDARTGRTRHDHVVDIAALGGDE